MKKIILILMIALIVLVAVALVVLISGCQEHESLEGKIKGEIEGKIKGEIEGKIKGEWKQLYSMPLALGEFSSAKDNGKIYFGGGFEPGGVTSSVFKVFDADKQSFQSLGSLPVGLHHTSFAYLDNKIYLAGGWEDLDFDATDYFYSYDIKNDEWTEKENMPHKRAAHRITAYKDSILVFGGVGESTLEVLKYNTTTSDWKKIAELPQNREHHTIEHFNDKIYLVSGRWDGQNIASIDVFDFNEESFEQIEIKKGVSGHGSAIIENKLHIIGGEHLREIVAYDIHQVIDLKTNEIYNATPLPTNRHGHRAYAHNNSIFAFGGAIDAEYNTFETTTSMVHKWEKN